MPLTDAERAFLDLLAVEYQHRSVAPMWCNRQLRERSIDPDEALPLLVLRREEWWVVGPDYFDAKTKSPGWSFLPDPPPCPWPDIATFRHRLGRLTRLGEENAAWTRSFHYCRDGLFVNTSPTPGDEPSGNGWQDDLIVGGWRFRGRAGGIIRGNVAEELRGVPASIWDLEGLPAPIRRCGYLVVVEVEPEPVFVGPMPEDSLRQLCTMDDLSWLVVDRREDEDDRDGRFPPPPG